MSRIFTTHAGAADGYERDAGENFDRGVVGHNVPGDQVVAYSAVVQAQALLAISHRLADLAEAVRALAPRGSEGPQSDCACGQPVDDAAADEVAGQDWPKLAEEIKRRRREQRWSQAEVARRAGLSEATVRRIERLEVEDLQAATRTGLEVALAWRDGTVDRILDGTVTEEDLNGGGRAATCVEDAGFWHKDFADATRADADQATCEGGC